MKKRQATKQTPPDTDQVVQNFADALAALVAHPDTPGAVCDVFVDAFYDLDNQFSPSVSRQEDAAEIRAKLPEYIQRARQMEGRAKQ